MSSSKSLGSILPGLIATDLMSLKPEFESYETEGPVRSHVAVLPRNWHILASDFSTRFCHDIADNKGG